MTDYKKDVLFMRRSKAGLHLYMFNKEGINGKDLLGEGVRSLLINVEDVQQLLGGAESIKVSVMREGDSPLVEQTKMDGDTM